MSVQTSTSTIQYTGNNSTGTSYTVPFYFFAATDLVVIVTDADGVETQLVNVTDYTVSGANDPAGGSLVTIAAWDNTYTVTIYREVDATQLTTYAENDQFPATSHERALDKLTHLVQQCLRKLGQCFRVTSASDSPTEVNTHNGESTVFGLDASGVPVLRSPSELVSFLNLPGTVIDTPTATWQDSTERALRVPDFIGQIGMQRTGRSVWVSEGLNAGDWFHINPELTSIATLYLVDGAVTASKLGSNAVTTIKILDSNVTAAKLATGAVTALKMGTAGMVMQSVSSFSTNLGSTSSNIPLDSTIPQIGEGALALTATITPVSATSKIRATVRLYGKADASRHLIGAIFRDSTANAITANAAYSNGFYSTVNMCVEVASTAAMATTFTLRFGADSGTAVRDYDGTNSLGSVIFSSLILEEIHE